MKRFQNLSGYPYQREDCLSFVEITCLFGQEDGHFKSSSGSFLHWAVGHIDFGDMILRDFASLASVVATTSMVKGPSMAMETGISNVDSLAHIDHPLRP